MRLHEFQADRAVEWKTPTKALFTVAGQAFECDFHHKYAKLPATGEYDYGVEVIFTAITKTGRKVIDNTGELGTNARAVFSHVISATVEYCQRKRPAFLYATGDKEEGKADLYATIAKVIVRRKLIPGYTKIYGKKGDLEDTFMLCRVDPTKSAP